MPIPSMMRRCCRITLLHVLCVGVAARTDAQATPVNASAALQRAGVILRPAGLASPQGASPRLYAVPGGLLAIDANGRIAGANEWLSIGRSSACQRVAARVVTPSLMNATSEAAELGALAARAGDLAAPALGAVRSANSTVDQLAGAALRGTTSALRSQGGVLAMVGDLVSGAGDVARDVANEAVSSATGVDLRQLEATLSLVVNEGSAIAGEASTMSAAVARLASGDDGRVGDACQELLPLASASQAFAARLAPLAERVELAGMAARTVSSLVPVQPLREVESMIAQLEQRVKAVRAPFAHAASDARTAAGEYEQQGREIAAQLQQGTTGAVMAALVAHLTLLGGYLKLAATPMVRATLGDAGRAGAELANAQRFAAGDPTEALAAVDRAYEQARRTLASDPEPFVRALMTEAARRDGAAWLGLPSTDGVWAGARVARASLAANDPDHALRALQLGVAAAATFDARLPWSRLGMALLLLLFPAAGIFWRRRPPRRSFAHAAPAMLALLVAAAVVPAGAQQSAPQGGRPLVHVVTSSGLHLRSEPRLDAPTLALLPKGARVCVLRAVGRDWYEVSLRLRGRVRRGFVSRGFTIEPPEAVTEAQVRAICAQGGR